MIDGTILSTAIIAVSTAVGGFATGRRTSSQDAIMVASETIDMLQSQVEILKSDKQSKDAELGNLRARVEILEGLVTQRAEVEELNDKVSLVKETVERIAIRVGA
jgi:hypothetical protein